MTHRARVRILPSPVKACRHDRRSVLTRVGWALAVVWSVAAPAGAGHWQAVETPYSPLAELVFRNLLASPLARTMPPVRWRLSTVRVGSLDAFSQPSGEIAVTERLAYLMGGERGVWASVLGHEIGHVVLQPQNAAYLARFREEIEKAYLEARVGSAQEARDWALQIAPAAPGSGKLKGARQKEYEADRVGLLLMVEAGYHPDYALQAVHWMQAARGDTPRFAEFMASHPRWKSREERTQQDYRVALAIFTSRWPDAAHSPGGSPPPWAVFGPMKVSEDANRRELVLDLPLMIERPAPMALSVEATFYNARGHRLETKMPQYRSSDGSLVVSGALPPSREESQPVELRLPLAALPDGGQKLVAVVYLTGGGHVIAVSYKKFRLP